MINLAKKHLVSTPHPMQCARHSLRQMGGSVEARLHALNVN
jgi:hypothetical protein